MGPLQKTTITVFETGSKAGSCHLRSSSMNSLPEGRRRVAVDPLQILCRSASAPGCGAVSITVGLCEQPRCYVLLEPWIKPEKDLYVSIICSADHGTAVVAKFAGVAAKAAPS